MRWNVGTQGSDAFAITDFTNTKTPFSVASVTGAVTIVGNTISEATLNTTDGTETTIATITPTDNSVGQLSVNVMGIASDYSGAIGGQNMITYRKASGTVSIIVDNAPNQHNADGGLASFASWQVTASGGNLLVKVTGKASTTVKWRTSYTIKPYAP